MGSIFEKVDNNTIRLVKSSEPVVTRVEFKLKFLKEQKQAILAQKQRDNALRDVELAEVQMLIDQCKTLNIVDESISTTTTILVK